MIQLLLFCCSSVHQSSFKMNLHRKQIDKLYLESQKFCLETFGSSRLDLVQWMENYHIQ